MRVLAIGPPSAWRQKGIDYEQFMADRVAASIKAGSRVLVHCGLHHAFTRYHQPELDLSGHAKAFVDRAGKILRRRFGEQVFLVTLHKPVWCGQEPWDDGLPLDGAIDCAAADGGPIGFDVAGSPVGDRVVDPAVYCAHGYPSLRLGEMTDGYVWSRPIEKREGVRLIPLDQFAPDEAAMREVAANNPFTDEKEMTRATRRAVEGRGVEAKRPAHEPPREAPRGLARPLLRAVKADTKVLELQRRHGATSTARYVRNPQARFVMTRTLPLRPSTAPARS